MLFHLRCSLSCNHYFRLFLKVDRLHILAQNLILQVRIIRHFDLLIYTDLDYLLLRWNYFWHIVHVLRLRMQNGRFIFRYQNQNWRKALVPFLKVKKLVWFWKRSPARTVHFSLNSSMKILSNWSKRCGSRHLVVEYYYPVMRLAN
jgi:hypothetical protein